MLKLVCVDEVHLFVMFGGTIWKEYILLKLSSLKYLIDNTAIDNTSTGSLDLALSLKLLLLLMTATLNQDLLMMLKNIIGIRMDPKNYY